MVERDISSGYSGIVRAEDVQTGFLFATPSFVSGMARVLDLFGQFDVYNTSETPELADSKAIYCDFRVVGQDLRHVLEVVYQQEPELNRHQWELAFSELVHAGRQGHQYTLSI